MSLEPQKERRKNVGLEKVLKEIMVDISPYLAQDENLEIQEVEQPWTLQTKEIFIKTYHDQTEN